MFEYFSCFSRTSRYTVAALESKLENYEKEIKQLQKALEKSDNYINDLENTCVKSKKSPSSSTNTKPQISPEKHQLISPKNKPEKLEIINKNDTTSLKSVKFAENNNGSEPVATKTKKSSDSKPRHHHTNNQNIIFTKPSISNDKFYGSPKKSTHITSSNGHISSFADRLKKNMSFDLETPSPNSTLNVTANNASSDTNSSRSSSHSDLLGEPTNNNGSQQSISERKPQLDYLFSPMKRLRLEESQLLEKPSFTIDPNDESIQIPPTTVTKNYELFKHNQHLNVTVTQEFNDCLQLLNEAETKVQSRVPAYIIKTNNSPLLNTINESTVQLSILKNNSNGLAEKYLQPSSPFVSHQESPRIFTNDNSNLATNLFNNQNSKLNDDQLFSQLKSNQNNKQIDYNTNGLYSNSNLFSAINRNRSSDQN